MMMKEGPGPINFTMFLTLFGVCVQDPTEDYLEMMMNEAPGPINFTMVLSL
jgi:hypothetical protein